MGRLASVEVSVQGSTEQSQECVVVLDLVYPISIQLLF